ncbi:hypothetical protein ACN3E9_03120 [Vibrio pectenicida]|uniref:Uncharacterized protein n=1 Tax=Vibrio pectenicida TaxID=62763 RepID=A0A427TX66_9VIBR|nr:hypothetical protein [Vibrio pectenicida]RSD28906.1 hypothetical protein EJA03_18860 [Vibrio pectenicida]
MKQQQTYIELFEQETQQAEQSACFSRFGCVLDFNQATNSVRINFADNPIDQPIWARLGRHFEQSELQQAMDNQVRCRIEFINQDLTLPIVTDLFFALLDDGKELAISADKLMLDSTDELIIGSSEAKTYFLGKEGSVTTKAEHVTSKANKAQRILGSTIAIN